MDAIDGHSGGGNAEKSLIACILIRVRLRRCKAIDFSLNLHIFGFLILLQFAYSCVEYVYSAKVSSSSFNTVF